MQYCRKTNYLLNPFTINETKHMIALLVEIMHSLSELRAFQRNLHSNMTVSTFLYKGPKVTTVGT